MQAAKTKWQRDPLQNACRAYCTCRQELNVLASVQHANITSLIGICSRPLALIVELAPLGALSQLLNNYKRSGARLHLNVIQDTASQVRYCQIISVISVSAKFRWKLSNNLNKDENFGRNIISYNCTKLLASLAKEFFSSIVFF